MTQDQIKSQLDTTIALIDSANEKRAKLDDLYTNWDKYTDEYIAQVVSELGLVDDTLSQKMDEVVSLKEQTMQTDSETMQKVDNIIK